jgi:hypothetical protein
LPSEVLVPPKRFLSVLVLALASSASPARAGEPTKLTDATFEALRAAILPTKGEERWREIPWRTTTWDAVVEAAATEKPVLLWAMNGHPLACT